MSLQEMVARRKVAEAEKELREADADYEDMELRLQGGDPGVSGVVMLRNMPRGYF